MALTLNCVQIINHCKLFTRQNRSHVLELSLDFLCPLPSGRYILGVIDYYSRYYEVCRESWCYFLDREARLLLSIASDNGPQFMSKVFNEYLENNGNTQRRVTPLWPQANGEIERQNRSMLKRMQIAQAEGLELRTYLTAYRATLHTTTGVSPAEWLFRRKIRTNLLDVLEQANVGQKQNCWTEDESKALCWQAEECRVRLAGAGGWSAVETI